MIPMLTSRYYILRIMKSKDYIDLADALSAYARFKREQLDYSTQQYAKTIRANDYAGALSALMIPVM